MTCAGSVKRLLFIAVLSLLISNTLLSEASCAHLLYSTDFDGKPAQGNKQNLIDMINEGHAIRVGWAYDFDDDKLADLIHWAEADFLTIFEGEVFGQVQAIRAQSPQRENATISLRQPFTQWSGILSSNGTLQGQLSTDRGALETRTVQIHWCSEHVD